MAAPDDWWSGAPLAPAADAGDWWSTAPLAKGNLPDPAPMPVPRPADIGTPVPLPPTRPADLPLEAAAPKIDDTGQNIPESENTLSAQLQQLVDGRRKAVMYPTGTEPLDLPDGFEVAHTPRGTFHYDPAQTTPEQIKHLSALGRENELLGLGPYNKDDVAARLAQGEPGVAVTERQPDGTEVKNAVGTAGTAPEQAAALEAGKTPGNSVAVENPAGALSQRQYDPNDPDNGAAEPAPVRSKLGRIAGEALAKGLVKGATDTAKAASGQAFTPAPPENDDSEVGKLLKQDLKQGWKDPAWWTAQMAHGIGSGAPMLAGGALGGVAGSAIGPEGTLPGAALGMAGMGMVQSLYPQYQAARQAGLSHDDAVKQAIDTSGIMGVGAAIMGSAPAVSLFGKDAMGALKKPVGEALAQLFAVAPGTMVGQQAATNLREGRPVDEGLLQAGAMGVAQGIPIVAGHAVSRAARGPEAPAPSTVDQVSDFLRQADAAKPGQAPPEPLAPEDSHPSTDPTIQAGLRAAAAERARQEAERAPQRAAEEAAAAQAATARKAQETADSAAGSPESGGRSPETGPSPGGSGREPTADDHLRAYGVPDEDISVMAPSEKQATLADLEQQGAPKGPVTAAEPEAEAPKAGTRAAPIKVETPEDVRAAEQHVDPDPTPAQMQAENYKHGHIDYEGLPVSIETAKGGTRRAPDGSWEVRDYPATYGRIKGTKATDGEAVDIFIGDKPPNGKVFVIHQHDPDTGAYDEPKAVTGVNSLGEAVRLYGKAYPDGAHLGRIGNFEELTTDEFKQRLKDGAFKKPPETSPETPPENTSKPLETPTAAAEPPVGKASKLPSKPPGKPQTLVAFLRKLGGIKDQGGELTARNAHRMHPGLVNNKRGMDLDQARRAAAEAGYLTPKNGIPPGMSLTDAAMADTTTNDLLAALDNHPHYAVGVERPSTDPRDDFDYVVDDIHKSLSDLGVRPELRDPELIAEAARIALAEGLDPDHAYESAIIRSLDNAERAAIDQDGDIPWEDYGSPATGSPFAGGEAANGAGGKDEGPGAQGKNPAGRPEHAGSGDDSQGAKEGQQHGAASALEGATPKGVEPWNAANDLGASLSAIKSGGLPSGDLEGFLKDHGLASYRLGRWHLSNRGQAVLEGWKGYGGVPDGEMPLYAGMWEKQRPKAAEPTVEPGAEGKPQTVIPGAEQISAAEQGQRGADKPLKPTVPQKDVGGLFGDSMDQADLLDAANAKTDRIAELRKQLITFASGMSRIGDLTAGAHTLGDAAKHGIGVDVGELSAPAMQQLAEAVINWRTQVFVDSGAFGVFRRNLRDAAKAEKEAMDLFAEAGEKPATFRALDFDKMMERYDDLLERINKVNEAEETSYPRPLLVMPDIVGDQTASIELAARYAKHIKAEAEFNLSQPIVPIQRGEVSLAEAYRQLVDVIGSDKFIVGIPSNEKAVPYAELLSFLKEAQPRRIHFLGAASQKTLAPKLQAIAEAGITLDHLSADANKLRSALYGKQPEGVTRADAIRQTLAPPEATTPRTQDEPALRPSGATVIRYPSGRYGFVGKVPDELAFVEGSTPEQIKAGKQYGARFGAKTTVFDSAQEAVDYAKERGFSVNVVDSAEKPSVAAPRTQDELRAEGREILSELEKLDGSSAKAFAAGVRTALRTDVAKPIPLREEGVAFWKQRLADLQAAEGQSAEPVKDDFTFEQILQPNQREFLQTLRDRDSGDSKDLMEAVEAAGNGLVGFLNRAGYKAMEVNSFTSLPPEIAQARKFLSELGGATDRFLLGERRYLNDPSNEAKRQRREADKAGVNRLLDEIAAGQKADFAEALTAAPTIDPVDAVPPDPPKPVQTDLQPGRTPAHTIAQHFLEGGTFRTIVEARAFVREHAGQNLDNKQVEETIEHGIVLAAREIAKGPDQKANFDKLVDLYNRQPLLSTRTSTSVSEQAYSTPAPLAYVASRLAGIARAKNVFEPTAGNGMLLIEADPADAWANELNPERRAALAQQGFNVSGDDATVLSVPSASFDSVITNPPFGSVTENKQSQVFEAGKLRTTAIDHAISLRALDAMRDNGKAVLIIGGVKPRNPADRAEAYQKSQQKRRFFYRLMEQYNVVDHFTVDGDLYKRQGAAWPVDVIVIHGRRKSDRKPPSAEVPELLTTWDAVKGKLDDVAGAQETTATPRPAGEPAGAVDPASLATGAKPGNGGVRGKAGTSEPAERPPVAPESGDVGGGNDLGEPAGVRGEPSDAGIRTEPEQPREPIRTDKRPDPDGGRQVDANEAGQVPYRQTSDRGTSLNTLAPANLATPMRESLRAVERRHGDVDHFVADSLGYKVEELGKYFSGEQIDALALGLDNIEKGSAIILGDQTGIGKGRVVAGMIRFAAKKGMTPVFVTEKPDLFGDMWRDLHDIGWDKHLGRPIEMMMTNANKRVPLDDDAVSWVAEAEQAKALGEPEPKRYGSFTAAQSIEAAKKKMDGVLAGTHKPDVVFTTYDQMNSTKGQENDRRNFLRAVAPQSFLIMDEAHNAGGAGDVENQARVDKDKAPPRSQVFREALGSAKAVMYSSATFAKSPAVMDLYSRTDMSLAVDNPKMIPDLVAKGGIPLQQMLSATLAKSGQYVRRERSFEGVNYDMTTVPVDQESYAEFTKGLRQIFEFDRMFEDERDEIAAGMAAELGAGTADDGGIGESGASSTNFASIMHNVVNQMVLSIKSKGAAEAAITALKGDQKPILALSTTMESFIKDYIADKGLKVGDPVPISFGDVMRRYLERTRRVTLKMPDDTKQHVMIPLSEMSSMAQAGYRQAQAALKNLSFSELPLSPIDYMRHEITKAGYSVREVTGRSLMLDYSSNPPTLVDRPRSEEGSAGKRVSIQAFNAGKLDAIILNKSGSTGVSLHASSKFKDQRKREMILVQADANIDTHMQMLGRPHRTGQVQPPNYKHLVADIPAEARPTAITMKKMASLNANTTGARKSKFSGEAVDFMNDYGDRVVAEVLKEDPTLNGQLGYPVHISDDGKMLVKGAAAKATGRLTLLNPPEQQAFLDAVTQKYTALIAELDASGENKLEAKSIDLQARTLESATIKPPAGPSPFQAAVNLEKVSAKAQGRALAPSEVMGKIDEATGHKSDGTFGSLRLADRVGARKVGEAMAALRPAAEAYAKERASALTEPDAKHKAYTSVMNGYEAVVEASRVAYPGAVVDLATRDGTMKAVVTGFSRAAKAKNPAAPSSWAVSFAVPDSSREVTVPVSRLTLSSDAPDEGFAVSPTGYTPEALTAQFEAARKEGREIRYVFTGNMLGAFDQTKGGGQIVNFTRENGEVHPGILMSRGFNASKFMAGRAVRFKDGKQVLAFLGKVPDGEIKSSDDIITIRKDFGVYEFEMPAAKAKGGIYYTDRSVRAVYDGWVKKGSVMRATLSTGTAERLINALQKVDAVFETRAHQDIAEGIVRPTPEESSTGTSAARRAPPAPVSFDIPPDVRTRGPAEVRRFRQLVAVATHMIDGMLPEGHGVEYRAVDTIRTSGDVLAASGGDPTDKALGLFSAQTVNRIHRDAEGNIVHRDQIVKLLIETTRDDKTPIQSLAHEIAHAMQYLRLYTPVEFRALQRERPELERIAARGNNLNLGTAAFDELVANAQGEYIGHAFGEANPGQTAPPMPGIIVRTARRIMAIWRRLRNLFAENDLLNKEGWKGLFKGRGYTTAEDIFKAAARGDFADRKMGEGQSWSNVKSESARPRPKRVGEGTKWEERRTAIVEAIADRMIRLKQAEEQIAGAFPAYRTESLSYGRINERIDDIVHHTLDPVSKDLRQNGIGPDDFGQYLYARHAERRNEIIRVRRRQDPAYDEGSGMSDADAQQILADVAASGQQAIYDRNAQRIYDLLDESLDTRVASGTMSQQQADDLRAEFGPDYVPLKGDAGVDPDDYSAAGGKRYSVKGRDFQQSTGRQSEAADPFTNSIFQAIEGVMRTETNRVAKAIRMLALTDLNSAAPTGMFKILQGAPLRPVLDRNGLVRMVQDRQFRDNPNVIVAKVGGLEKYVEIQNDNLAKAVKDTYLRSPDNALRFLQSALSIYSRLRTTLNPFFSVKNFIRDNQDAVIAATIHLDGGAAKFAKHLPGAMEASRAYVMHGTETPEFNQFRLSGGRVTYAKVRSLDQIQRRIQRMISGSSANPMNIVRHLVDGLQAWSEIPETAVRFALYKAAREAGRNVDEAASLALEGTLNFYRRGGNDLVKYITATQPFLNANIQSPLRAARMAQKNWKGYVAYLAALPVLGAGLAVWNYLIGGKDTDGIPFADKIPTYEHERNWMIYTGAKDAQGRPIAAKIPSFPEFTMLAGIARAMVAMVAGGAPLSEILGNQMKMVGSVIPGVGPGIFQGAWGIYANKDFKGSAVHPDPYFGQKNVPSSEIMWPGTAKGWQTAARVIARVGGGDQTHKPAVSALDLHPEDVKYLVKEAAGSLYPIVAWLAGKAAQEDGGKTPLLGDFVMPGWEHSNYDKQKFTDAEGEANAQKMASGAKGKGSTTPRQGVIAAAKRDMKADYKELDRVRENKQLSPDVKQARIEAIQYRINERRKQAQKALERVH